MPTLQKARAFLDEYKVYDSMPIYTAMTLVLPAITHYFQQEYYTAFFLVLFSMLRAGYHIGTVMKAVPMNVYHITYVLSNAAVHFNILATGISYRSDFTNFFMLLLAVYESMIKLWRLPAIYDNDGKYKDSEWNIYIGVVLVWNIIMHDPLFPSVFVKGLFWGAYLCRFYMTRRCYPFGSLNDFRNQIVEIASFMQFAHINTQAQKAFPNATDEIHLPPDDLD